MYEKNNSHGRTRDKEIRVILREEIGGLKQKG